METTCPSMHRSRLPAHCHPLCTIQVPPPPPPKKWQECMLGSVVSSGCRPIERRGPFLWSTPRGWWGGRKREWNPNPSKCRGSIGAGGALRMPMTWDCDSFPQRPLPRHGLQVCQQVPLPLSLWELQVRVQDLGQGRVALSGPHQPQQQPRQRARPVRVLLPAVSLPQPGGGKGVGRARAADGAGRRARHRLPKGGPGSSRPFWSGPGSRLWNGWCWPRGSGRALGRGPDWCSMGEAQHSILTLGGA